MRVKIIKCSDDNYWYHNQIGEEIYTDIIKDAKD